MLSVGFSFLNVQCSLSLAVVVRVRCLSIIHLCQGCLFCVRPSLNRVRSLFFTSFFTLLSRLLFAPLSFRFWRQLFSLFLTAVFSRGKIDVFFHLSPPSFLIHRIYMPLASVGYSPVFSFAPSAFSLLCVICVRSRPLFAPASSLVHGAFPLLLLQSFRTMSYPACSRSCVAFSRSLPCWPLLVFSNLCLPFTLRRLFAPMLVLPGLPLPFFPVLRFFLLCTRPFFGPCHFSPLSLVCSVTRVSSA